MVSVMQAGETLSGLDVLPVETWVHCPTSG